MIVRTKPDIEIEQRITTVQQEVYASNALRREIAADRHFGAGKLSELLQEFRGGDFVVDTLASRHVLDQRRCRGDPVFNAPRGAHGKSGRIRATNPAVLVRPVAAPHPFDAIVDCSPTWVDQKGKPVSLQDAKEVQVIF